MLCNFIKNEKAQGLVEFAIGAAVVLIVLIAFFQFGLLLYKQAWMDFVAKEAVRELAVTGDRQTAERNVTDRLAGLGFDSDRITVVAYNGSTIQPPTPPQCWITVTYRQQIAIPFFWNQPSPFELNLSSHARTFSEKYGMQ